MLCRSCVHAQIINNDRVFCHKFIPEKELDFTVLSCSKYKSSTDKEDYQFEEIAWVLKVSSAGKVIGFRPPKYEKG